MPAQTKQSTLLKKLGDRGRAAFDANKDAAYEPPAGGGLPAGIENGVARVVKCEFGEYKDGKMKGEPFFIASAVVMSPADLNGVPVKGLRTTIGPEPLCDTPTRSRRTIEEHVEWVQNQLKGMGVETAGTSVDDLESLAQAVVDAAPHVRFRTWSGSKQEILRGDDGKWYCSSDPNKKFATEGAVKLAFPYAGSEPNVQHVWQGVVEWAGDGGAADHAVTDNTPPSPAPKPNSKPPAKAAAKTPPPAPEPDPEPDPDPDESPADEYTDQGDLDSLGERADNDDEAAQQTLTEMAEKCGVPEAKVKKAGNWAAVAELIKAAGGGGDGDSQPTDAETPPAKGDVYDYVPDPKKKDARTKQPVKVECQVAAVDVKNRTVDLVATGDPKKKFPKVSWDALAGD